MNGMQILVAAMSRRDARRINREFNKASVEVAGVTAHAQRRIERIGWEGKRSPSRLGRMGERAQQLNDIVGPLSLTITAAAQACITIMDLIERREQFRDRNTALPGDDPKGANEGEKTPTTTPKADPTEARRCRHHTRRQL